MENITPKIKGYGVLEINGKKIKFENKVNINLIMACQGMLDSSWLTNRLTQVDTRNAKAYDFTLLNEEANLDMQGVYTQMAKIPIESFKLIQGNFFKSTVKASGVILKTGIVRSAGYNVIRKSLAGSLPKMPISTPQRAFRLDVTTSFTLPVDPINLMYPPAWIYHAEKKALYKFIGVNIYKIPFNIDTGELGSMSIISTNWFDTSPINKLNFIELTDGKNNKIITSSISNMKVFNFLTEVVTDVFIDPDLYNGETTPPRFDWDDHIQKMRCPQTRKFKGSSVKGFTLSLTGELTLNTNPPSPLNYFARSDLLYYKKDYWVAEKCIGQYDYGNSIDFTTIQESCIFPYPYYVYKPYRINDEFNITTLCAFDATVNPTKLTITMWKEPDTSLTIISLPETYVQAGQSFSIEYTFELCEGDK